MVGVLWMPGRVPQYFWGMCSSQTLILGHYLVLTQFPGYALIISCLSCFSSRNLCSDDNIRLAPWLRKHVRWAQCNWCKRMGVPWYSILFYFVPIDNAHYLTWNASIDINHILRVWKLILELSVCRFEHKAAIQRTKAFCEISCIIYLTFKEHIGAQNIWGTLPGIHKTPTEYSNHPKTHIFHCCGSHTPKTAPPGRSTRRSPYRKTDPGVFQSSMRWFNSPIQS